MKTICFVGLALALALLATGCAGPPTEEMNNAVEAVARAENDNDAVLHAPAALARAREALRMMRREADSRRFDAARAYAAEAIAAAERAVAEGRAGAEQARREAHALISDLPPLIAEAERGMGAARAAGLDLDYDALDDALNGARERANLAVDAYASGLYGDAIAQGRYARNGLADINQRIAGAAVAVPQGK
ncbi:MAG: DUF4398 domain-containing protein [Treponema sp.]|nr:DUF4398 domain-containing protein [Treponema sp.]